jgi:hypothetical protein
MFRALNKQHLQTPKELRIAGQYAILNPITGEMLPPEERTVELEDLYQDYDVRAKGATQFLSKVARQQNLAGLLQTIGTNPAAAVYVNWVNLLRQTFKIFEFTNSEELLNLPENMLAMNAAALGVQSGGGGPQQPMVEGGAPEGSPGPQDVAAMMSPAVAAGEVG